MWTLFTHQVTYKRICLHFIFFSGIELKRAEFKSTFCMIFINRKALKTCVIFISFHNMMCILFSFQKVLVLPSTCSQPWQSSALTFRSKGLSQMDSLWREVQSFFPLWPLSISSSLIPSVGEGVSSSWGPLFWIAVWLVPWWDQLINEYNPSPIMTHQRAGGWPLKMLLL